VITIYNTCHCPFHEELWFIHFLKSDSAKATLALLLLHSILACRLMTDTRNHYVHSYSHKYKHYFITETIYLEYIIRKKNIFYNTIHAAAFSHSLLNTVKTASCTFNEHVFLQNNPKCCLWYS
jgi:hypothetical protein